MVITLIGFRGVGKSSVGPQLAARLGWTCVDADQLIVERAGQSIPEIFSEEGEPRFREIEAAVLSDVLQQNQSVVATGGGAVLNAQTRGLMREAGPVVWLRASVETIWSRIAQSMQAKGDRPALTDRDPREEVEWLIQQREPIYAEAATLTVDTDDRAVSEIVDEISTRLPSQPGWTK